VAGVRYVTPQSLGECTKRWLAALRPWSRGRPVPALGNAALLVLDLQRFFAEPASHAYLPALDAVLPRIRQLISAFHAAGRPVVLTRHGTDSTSPEGATRSMMQRWWRDDLIQGEERAQLIAALADDPRDLELDKSRYSAFSQTRLHEWLDERGCDTVVVTGVMTHLCCETTTRDAFMHDLAPVVVADGCATQDEELHLGALRSLCHGFAVVTSTDQVLARLEGGDARGTDVATAVPGLSDQVELAIAGAGPAGLAAAIQAARAGVDVCLLDPAGRVGGQARTADNIENYPGFPGGIDGGRLMDRFATQAHQLGLEVSPLTVESIEQTTTGDSDTLRVGLGGDRSIDARAVILATGATPITLDLPLSEGAPVVHRTDELPRVREGRFLVVGGGEAALDQALRLQRLGAAAVTVAIRGQRPGAIKLLVERAGQRGIQLLTGTCLVGLVKDETAGAWLAQLQPGQSVPVDAVVVCVGKRVDLPRLPGGVTRNPLSAPAVDRLGRTSLARLYLVGDCCRGRYRQVAIAAGDGVATAMHAVSYLQTGQWEDPA